MGYKEIDWNTSIEQQVDQIVAAVVNARKLVRQIKLKKNGRPELITSENYSYFQSVISSVNHLALEVEINPLYKLALLQLNIRRKRKQQWMISKYFRTVAQVRVDGNLGS
jgi:hypothetical protein